jgi:hypothetical protein
VSVTLAHIHASGIPALAACPPACGASGPIPESYNDGTGIPECILNAVPCAIASAVRCLPPPYGVQRRSMCGYGRSTGGFHGALVGTNGVRVGTSTVRGIPERSPRIFMYHGWGEVVISIVSPYHVHTGKIRCCWFPPCNDLQQTCKKSGSPPIFCVSVCRTGGGTGGTGSMGVCVAVVVAVAAASVSNLRSPVRYGKFLSMA